MTQYSIHPFSLLMMVRRPRTFLLVGKTMPEAQSLHDELVAVLPPDLIGKTIRSVGQSRTTLTDGTRIIPVSHHQIRKGRVHWVVDHVISSVPLVDDLADALDPCMATTGGKIWILQSDRPEQAG